MQSLQLRSSHTLTNIFLAGALSGFGVYAHAGDFTLQNNQLTITGGGTSSGFAASPTISADGIVGVVDNVSTTSGVGIPSFSFTLLSNIVPDGTYSFRVGMVVTDDNTQKRMEARLEQLDIVVTDNGATINGVIPDGQSLRVLAQNGGGDFNVMIDVANQSDNGPVRINGGNVTFDAENLIARIRASHSQFDSIILAEFDDPAHYTYAIVAQQISGPEQIRFGTEPAFTPFPRIRTDCTADPASRSSSVFMLNNNELAAQFPLAYAVQGQFNIVGAAVDGGDPAPTAFTENCGDAAPDDLNQELSDLIDSIIVPSEGPVPATVVAAINDALGDAVTLAEEAVQQLNAGDADPVIVLNILDTLDATLAKAGEAIQRDVELDDEQIGNLLASIADILNAMDEGDLELSDAQRDRLQAWSSVIVGSLETLVPPVASVEDAVMIAEGASAIVNGALALGVSLDETLFNNVVGLSDAIVENAFAALAASIGVEAQFTSHEQVRALLLDNHELLQVVLDATSIALNSSRPHDRSRAEEDLRLRGIPPEVAIEMAGDLSITQNPAGVVLITRAGSMNGNDLIRAGIGSDAQVSVDEASGAMSVRVGGRRFFGFAVELLLVSESIPNGVNVLGDGRVLIVNNNFGVVIAPTARHNFDFAAGIFSRIGKPVKVGRGGGFHIPLDSNRRFSGKFSFDAIDDADEDSPGPVTDIREPGNGPTHPDHVYIVHYANGTTQRIVPFADNPKFYNSLARFGFEVNTDDATGIVTISEGDQVLRFKPGFIVAPPTPQERQFRSGNRDAFGIAYLAGDVNGDGITDYRIISENSVQVMYGTN